MKTEKKKYVELEMETINFCEEGIATNDTIVNSDPEAKADSFEVEYDQ